MGEGGSTAGRLRGRVRLMFASTVRRMYGVNGAEARLPPPEDARLVECREDEIVAPLAPAGGTVSRLFCRDSRAHNDPAYYNNSTATLALSASPLD